MHALALDTRHGLCYLPPMPKVKVTNRGPNAIELFAQKRREIKCDEKGIPILDAQKKLQYVDFRMVTIPLEKGAHAVESDDLEYVLANNESAAAIFDAQCTLEDADPDGGSKAYDPKVYLSDLSQLTISDAIAAVKDCKDPKRLEEWLMQEARKPVKRAMHEKHRELLPGDEADA